MLGTRSESRPRPAACEIRALERATMEVDQVRLLERYLPFVVYDSRESYRADSPAVLTDLSVPRKEGGYCNSLRRKGGETVAVSDPSLFKQPYPRLDLDFLAVRRGKYAGGIAVQQGDYVDAAGTNYPADAARMHRLPELADRVCGRVVVDGATRWLQYWFFYYFNDMLFDRHEGDWEMIQLGLDARNVPRWVTYSQHEHGETRAWTEIQTRATGDGGRAPVVYPALGSHAAYFEAGYHHSGLLDGLDRHDGGKGLPVRPQL